MASTPLPVRDGLNPSRLRLSDAGDWTTVLEYLVARFPHDAARLREKVALGEVVAGDGTAITDTTAFAAREFVYLYRDPPAEVAVPFAVEILHRDENLLVVDKPHFLATMPRGGWVTETALVRLRRELDLPELSPAHRLDRLTAGVLVFTVRPGARGAYQSLFAEQRVHKEYEALAPAASDLTFPREVRSRIEKQRGVLQAREVPGEINAISRVELLDTDSTVARYRLLPRTGKTHQLRVHMNSLGIPILGDPLYPAVQDIAPQDFSQPLRLLARKIEFDDPFSGSRRYFASRRNLAAWRHSTPGPR